MPRTIDDSLERENWPADGMPANHPDTIASPVRAAKIASILRVISDIEAKKAYARSAPAWRLQLFYMRAGAAALSRHPAVEIYRNIPALLPKKQGWFSALESRFAARMRALRSSSDPGVWGI